MFDPSEAHYTVQELAASWNVSADTVRREFQDEDGVLHFAKPKPCRRHYDAIRIPASVAARVYARLISRSNGRRP